jgi:hypothetical protein
VLGCLLLLLRKSLAVPVFIVSLVAVVIQDIYVFGMTDAAAVFGSSSVIIQTVVFVVAVLLVWYSRRATATGLLR